MAVGTKTLPDGTVEVTEAASFTVPDSSPVESQRGKELSFSFTFRKYPSLDVARKNAVTDADLLKAINVSQKVKSRSNAYQTALAPHRPSEVAPDDIFERMVRDAVRLGIPEDLARKNLRKIYHPARFLFSL